MNANLAAATKTTLTHFLACLVAAFLGAVIMRTFVFGSGGSSFFEVIANVTSHFLNEISGGQMFVLLGFYAIGIGTIGAHFFAHRWWHVLIWATVVFGVIAYFLSDRDVAFAMYSVIAAPWFGVGAFVGWIISRRFWSVLQ